MVTQLTAQTFKEKIQGKILVDFWASWCGPCKMLAPIFEQVSQEYTGTLDFGKLSTEEFPEVAGEHQVTGIPCMILFSKGKEVDRIIGFQQKAALKSKIDALLANVQ